MTRIVIDPGSVRSAAGRMRTAAGELQALSSQVSCAAIPEMPPGERWEIELRLRTAGDQLLRGASSIRSAAGDLDRRAHKAVLANQGSFMGPVFGGRSFWRSTRKIGGRNWPGWRHGWKLSPGTWEGRSLARGQQPLTKSQLRDFRRNINSGNRVSRDLGIYVGDGGSIAAKRWGGKGSNHEVALGEVAGEYKAGAKIGPDGVRAAAEASVAANLVRATRRFGGDGPLQGEIGGSIGANAKGEVEAKVGRDGVAGRAGGRAFVGGEAHVSGKVQLPAGVQSKAQAGVSYGAGVQAEADFSVGKKMKAKVHIGATLGIGGNVAVEVEVDAEKAVKDVAGVADKGIDAIGDGLDKLGIF
ncbi:hypothetical protein DVA67_022805 [Solirubrobacter sp. CPCC 204708]|uniref:Uncharacterized protein n=1 Tax=Solirubrobacter deserti TaxID=2282478 RepID=A0ABT4RI29_9ACTN|nr:hypothetical protein [Solirubrobacter deserti]MBE2318824.1 hypothetical protein [Solirubrobacter deserti]MDA0138204.1 hypothetical protein [Solirubrobacter deserti]